MGHIENHADGVHKSKAQTRRREFEELKFKDGELIEEFTLRLTGIVNDLQLLNDPTTKHKEVLKFLRAVPCKYRQMAMAIELLVDLKAMTIEEISGWLMVVKESYDLDDASHASGRLLLIEEEGMARQ